jgi:hypothetical protein
LDDGKRIPFIHQKGAYKTSAQNDEQMKAI